MRRKLFVVSAIAVLALGGYLLGWSSLLSTKSVAVIGAPTGALEKQIANLADIKIGQPLARIEPRILQSQIEKYDWVERSSISRNWINGKVSIEIQARTPVAAVGGKYIDQTGFIFDPPISPTGNLPQLIAPDSSTRLSAIELFLSLPDTFASNVSSLTATGNQYLITNGKYGINWGRSGNTDLKIKVFNQLIDLPENKKINYLDLSNPKSPIVR
mgnify:CR=1 FL=1